MSNPRSQSFTFLGSGDTHTTNSVDLEGLAVVRLDIPALAATTAKLRAETTPEGDNVPDASVTDWRAVTDEQGNKVEFPASAAAATSVLVDFRGKEGLRRFRLRALTSGDGDVAQSGSPVVTPVFQSWRPGD